MNTLNIWTGRNSSGERTVVYQMSDISITFAGEWWILCVNDKTDQITAREAVGLVSFLRLIAHKIERRYLKPNWA